MKKDPYLWCRCGYTIHDRAAMRKHLYHLKKRCPALKNDIDMTDHIKQYILDNRIYHIPKEPAPPTINQTINNYNTMNNYIAGLDVIDKLTKYLNHKQMDLLSFNESVEDKYARNVRRLERNEYKHGFSLQKNDFMDIIDQVSNITTGKTLEEFNIMYDAKVNKVKLYEEGIWQEMLLMSGLKKIMLTIQEYYLDAYECFLIRHLVNDETSVFKRQQYKELLDEYYKFIGCLSVDPYVKNKPDNEILYNASDDGYFEETGCLDIQDVYVARYEKIKGEITKNDVNGVTKQIVDIIKRNSIRNVDEMNKKILELFTMDESFKSSLLPT